MDKIDLNAITEKVDNSMPSDIYERPKVFARLCMIETIHQALVLASENATATAHENPADYGTGEKWAVVDKQSILSIIDLIK